MSELSETTNIKNVRPVYHGPATISLVCLFQVVTACCMFFACMTLSPLAAIIATLVTAPAIIRTGFDSDLHRRNGINFDWRIRLTSFVVSLGLVLLGYMAAAIVFAAISIAFGIIWVFLAFIVGAQDLLPDVAFVGTAGGMIWGMFGALFCLGICAVKWRPQLDEESE